MSRGAIETDMTTEKPKTQSLKMPMDVIESARIVAAFKGQSMADLVGDILRPALAKMEKEEMAKRTKAKEGKS
jgi:plasmid stability protein